MNVADDLRAVQALISRPAHWGKGAIFREGRRCLIGAIDHVAEGKGERGFPMFLAMVTIVRPYDGRLSTWNDALERTHAQVMEAIDSAIEAAEAA